MIDQSQKKNKMDMMYIEKLRAQYNAGISIRKISILWNLPYASLYMALKKVDGKKKKTTNELSLK